MREYLAELRRQNQEVFNPLEYRAGDVAQLDFFEVTVDIGGQRQTAWKFLLRLPFSGKDFAWTYKGCNQIAFLDWSRARVRVLGGRTCSRRLRQPHRSGEAAPGTGAGADGSISCAWPATTCSSLALRAPVRVTTWAVSKHGASVCGCSISAPYPAVRASKRSVMELQARLETAAYQRKDRSGRTVADLFEQERRCLHSLHHRPFEPRLAQPVVNNRQSLVRVEGADYSLPSHWA